MACKLGFDKRHDLLVRNIFNISGVVVGFNLRVFVSGLNWGGALFAK